MTELMPTAAPPSRCSPTGVWLPLAAAGFRRWSTYRQAAVATVIANSVFGLLRVYVLLSAVAGAGGVAGGYDDTRMVSYVWLTQGLLGVVLLWGWTDLADRVRTGDVVADLVRPVSPLTAYLAADVGRAGYAALTGLAPLAVVGSVLFDLYLPASPVSYALAALSVVLATVVCFSLRYLVNLTAFWLLDIRGVTMMWILCSTALGGMAFPLRFLPEWAQVLLWLTPFPALVQVPTDIVVEFGGLTGQLTRIGYQASWMLVLLVLCLVVQRRALRRLVVQGG